MKLRHWLSHSRLRRKAKATRQAALDSELDDVRVLAAQAAIRQTAAAGVLPRLAEAEFRVFSQFGDDGIIQYLVRLLDVRQTTFIEFGVENYTEANTRFLLVNNNWRGLILDASEKYMESVRRDPIHWRHDLTAACAFIDRDNINGLIERHGFSGEIGLLHVDIDGNDYWVWDRIDVVQPAVVIVEYNSVFGAHRAVTIPYNPTFNRTSAHYSNLYWGCSLKALCVLASRKGYAFVGSNSAGNNAYFVRRDRLGPLAELSAPEGYVESRFRESRDVAGRLTFLGGADRRRAIAELKVLDVETNDMVRVGDLE